MKTIGFTNKRDEVIIRNKYLDMPLLLNGNTLDEVEKKNVIKYLNGHESVFSITWALFDGEKYIGPYMIFTDGEWLWPSHFSYYLFKNNFHHFNEDFLNHLRTKKFEINSLTEIKKKEATVFIERELLNTK